MIGEIEERREIIEEEASWDEFGETGRVPMEGSVGCPREILDRVFNYPALCCISSFPRLPGFRDLGPALFPLLLFFFSFFFFYCTGCCSLWISICYGSCQPTWNYLIKDMYLFLFFKCLLGITFFYGRWWVLGEWWGKPWFCECL